MKTGSKDIFELGFYLCVLEVGLNCLHVLGSATNLCLNVIDFMYS